VNDAARAEAWVEQTLADARALVAKHPLGPRDQSMESFEASLRGMVAAWLRDLTPYVGLTLDEAHARAASTRDFLCVHRGDVMHRANARPDRVHIELQDDGRVQTARLDSPPPWHGLRASPTHNAK
jgi:hypothetical protein